MPRSRVVRWAIYTAAICSVGLGVAMMVRARLGVAPNDVLNTGIGTTAGVSVGAAAWITAAVAMVISWALGRRPLPATVLGGLIVGVSIDLVLAVLGAPVGMVARVALLAGGLIVIWAAITGVVATDVGAGPLELIMLALLDRRVGIRIARWGIELTLLGLGIALGGAVGVGTLLFATLTGPVLARTLPPASRALGTQLSKVDSEAAASASLA